MLCMPKSLNINSDTKTLLSPYYMTLNMPTHELALPPKMLLKYKSVFTHIILVATEMLMSRIPALY